MTDQTGSIRRLRSRRPDVTVLVAGVVVAIVVVALLLVRPTVWTPQTAAPTTRALTSSIRVCPPGLAGDDHVTAYSDAAGTLTTSAGSTRLAAGTPAELHGGRGARTLTVHGAAAAGIVAGRWSLAPLAATECGGPVADRWFTGLGAGPVHDSVVEITNPNAGEAVVDLAVYGAHGPLDVPALRGIAIPSHATKTFDLLKTMPRPGALAVHAMVDRGEASIDVVDRALHLTGTRGADEWLAPQAHPQQRNVILGVTGPKAVLTTANTTDGQVTVTLKVVTNDAVITPAGAPTVRIPPDSVAQTPLAKVLGGNAAQGAVGIEVDATGRVAAAVRQASLHDLVTATTGDRVGQTTRTVVPPGDKRLMLLGDTGVGSVAVTSYDADGKRLGQQHVAVQHDQGASVSLPAGATVVEVAPQSVSVVGSIVVSNPGSATVIPLREHLRRNLVPAVRPALH